MAIIPNNKQIEEKPLVDVSTSNTSVPFSGKEVDFLMYFDLGNQLTNAATLDKIRYLADNIESVDMLEKLEQSLGRSTMDSRLNKVYSTIYMRNMIQRNKAETKDLKQRRKEFFNRDYI